MKTTKLRTSDDTVLARVAHILLVKTQNGSACLANSAAVSYKAKYLISVYPSSTFLNTYSKEEVPVFT